MPSSKDNPEKVAEAAAEQVQKVFDEANEQGYFGSTPDPTPRDHYTVGGVNSNKPTPETNDGLADEARKANLGQ